MRQTSLNAVNIMGKSKELIEQERLEYIDALLNDVENYVPETITDWQLGTIENLLNTAAIPSNEIEQIKREMWGYDSIEALNCIERLKQLQVDPIDSGNNYSQTDINRKLDNMGL